MLLGFALVGCEVMTPGGFFFLFFGLGAITVGVLAALGAGGPGWVQWLLFSLISIGFLVPLRGRLLRRVATGDDQLNVLVAAELQDPRSASVELSLNERDAELVGAVERAERLGE